MDFGEIKTFLGELEKSGIKISVKDDRLVVRNNAGKQGLKSGILDRLKSNKEDIRRFLKKHAKESHSAQVFEKVPRTTTSFPLSSAQQRILLQQELNKDNTDYIISAAFRVEGKIQIQALKEAVSQLVQRHEILRTNYAWRDGEPRQIINAFTPDRVPFAHQIIDGGEQALCAAIDAERYRPFDLGQGCMLRVALLSTENDAQSDVLLLAVHHIAFDGWSMNILLEDFSNSYNSSVDGKEIALQPLEFQYLDYVAWQSSEDEKRRQLKQREYWLRKLAYLPAEHTIPLDSPRPDVRQSVGSFTSLELPQTVARQISAFCKAKGLTPFMLLHGALAIVLSRHGLADDVVIGTPVANRRREELTNIIGFFVNTLVLRTSSKFSDLYAYLNHIKETNLEAQANQDLSFEQLFGLLGVEPTKQHTPLFQIMLSLDDIADARVELNGISLEAIESETTLAQYDLDFSATFNSQGLKLELTYDASLFSAPRMTNMLSHFARVLTQISEGQESRIARLAMLGKQENRHLLELSKGPSLPLAQPFPVQVQIAKFATQTPDAIAVCGENEAITYRQLDQRANQIAHLFLQKGLNRGDYVAISMGRRCDRVIATLAVLKAGGAFLPIEPGLPAERVEMFIEDANPKFFVVDDEMKKTSVTAEDLDWRALVVDSQSMPVCEPDVGANSELLSSPCYMMFTSGTSGRPKGVIVEHRQLFYFTQQCKLGYEMSHKDSVLHFSSYSFDISIEEVFGCLCTGGRLVLRDERSLIDADHFWRFCQQHKISVVSLPTAFWHQLLVQGNVPTVDSLRLVIIGGEAINPELARSWFERDNAPVLANTYGPTEATVTATSICLTRETNLDGDISIGSANAETQVYVLAKDLTLVPQGGIGEIHIGGEGVARGYHERESLTQEKFIPDPFSTRAGARLYKTGDLAVYADDGGLKFIGRSDDQVKIRGYRVEPGEVEARLAHCSGVEQAAVVVATSAGEKRLISYLKVSGSVSTRDVMSELKGQMPDYMIPSQCVLIEQFPLTANGKIDKVALCDQAQTDLAPADASPSTGDEIEGRLAELWLNLLSVDKALPEDSFFALGGHSLLAFKLKSDIEKAFDISFDAGLLFTHPSLGAMAQVIRQQVDISGKRDTGSASCGANQTLTKLSAIWQSLLGRDEINASESFFALGGHSLLVFKLKSEIETTFGVSIEANTLFNHATLSELTQQIDQVLSSQQEVSIPLVERTPEAHYPLSFAQQRLWLVDRLNGSEQYNLTHPLMLNGQVNLAHLEQALNTLVQRHQVLRTRILEIDGEPRQQVQSEVELKITRLDYSQLSQAQRESKFNAVIENERTKAFDLSRDLMLRANCITLNNAQTMLLLSIHHIAFDGWSDGILIGELVALYNGLQAGEAANLAPLSHQYIDYAVWQNTQMAQGAFDTSIEYWQKQLADLPNVHQLPLDHARPSEQAFEGKTLFTRIDAEQVTQLKALCSRQKATLFMGLHAVFSVLLSRYSNELDIVVGTPTANREQTQIQDLIGFFVNNLVIRNQLDAADSFSRVIEKSKGALLGAFEHQELPFDRLLTLLKTQREKSHSPLFQVMLSLAMDESQPLSFDGMQVVEVESKGTSAMYDLTLNATEIDGELSLAWEYDTALFNPDTIARMAEHFSLLMSEMLARPEQNVFAANMQTAAEAAMVAQSYRDSAFEEHLCIDQLFEQQVKNHPYALAVVDGEQSFSYQEVNHSADKVAAYLRQQNFPAETFIAMSMERSIEAVVTILGIFKAGLAYVPIDNELPAQRISYILEDSQAPLLILDASEGARNLANTGVATTSVEAILEQAPTPSSSSGFQRSSAHLAYMVYTSGTTGQPKGVMVEHKAMMARLSGWDSIFDFATDAPCVLQMAGLSVDIFLGDMVKSLLTGGQLVLCRKEWLLDMAELQSIISRHRVSFIDVVPTLLRSIMDYAEQQQNRLASLRHILVGSEAWYGQDLTRLQALVSEECRCFNIYGQTESVIDATCCDVTQITLADEKIVPIGSPLTLTEVSVLNPAGQAVPIGVSGELAVGGPGLARGYHGKPELTAQKFIETPGRRRTYLTGDQAILLADGTLEFLGRKDDQVKIRGYRIELAEVESQLQALPGVSGAVVLVHQSQDEENKSLVAYLETANGKSSEFYRGCLLPHLPAYMIPSAFVTLEAFPISATGKVDRKALPQLDWAEVAEGDYQAPVTELEITLATIWQRVLGREQVGTRDNFFALGGDSIKLIQVANGARKAGLQVSVKALLSHQSIAELITSGLVSTTVTEHKSVAAFELLSESERALIDEQLYQDAYPLTLLQDGSRFHQLRDGNYHIVEAYSMQQEWNEKAFMEALNALVARHEILRTSFLNAESRALQLVRRQVAPPAEIKDLSLLSQADAVSYLRTFIEEEETRLFSDDELQWRFSIFVLSSARFVIVFSHHHAILDGWSVATMTTELNNNYQARLARQALPQSSELPMFREYVNAELQSLQSEESKTYWGELICGSHLPEWNGTEGEDHYTKTLNLSKYHTHLLAVSNELNVPMRTLLLSVHLYVLARVSGADNIVSSVVSHGRLELAQSDECLGLFLNTQPVAASIAQSNWRAFVNSVNQSLINNWPHRHYPVAQIQQDTGMSLSGALFNFIDFHVANKMKTAQVQNGELESVLQESNEGHESVNYGFDVTCSYASAKGELNLQLALGRNDFREQQLERYLGYFDTATHALCQNVEHGLETETSLLSGDEVKQLLVWGRPEQAKPHVDSLFEHYVAATEHASQNLAVAKASSGMTFAELTEQSGRVAQALWAKGVRHESRVGVHLSASADLILTILAIWRLGGVFVPLSKEYPDDRLSFILDDAGIEFVIAESDRSDSGGFASRQLLTLEHLLCEEPAKAQPTTEICGDDVAYLLYTSGTTGQPKGVQVTHRNALSYLAAVTQRYALKANENVLQFSNISFDIFIEELMLSIFSGNRLVMLDSAAKAAPQTLLEEMVKHQISIASFPTAYWSEFAKQVDSEAALRLKHALRLCIVGGEAMKPDALVQWQQKIGPQVCLLNTYGPTETTVVATVSEVTHFNPASGSMPDIGTPLENCECYVLTDSKCLAPQSVTGELYIAGSAVSAGYLNRDEANAASFVSLKVGQREVGTAYRTGDLVRWNENGQLEYQGRADNQVKILGYRVELSEIEAKIQRLSKAESVLVSTFLLNGQKTLSAYLVRGEETLDKSEYGHVISQLKSLLPEYMVPRHMATLDALPLTPNGKIDHSKLPAPEFVELHAANTEPMSQEEQAVAALYAQTLAVDPQSLDVSLSFFELGGNSLSAIIPVNRLNKELSLDVSMLDFLKDSSIKFLGSLLSGGTEQHDNNVLVDLSDTQSRSVYLLPGAGMSALPFVPLAKALSPSLSLKVLQDPGFSGGAVFSDLQSMLADYTDVILQDCDDDVIQLAGFSVGACIAFEIARELMARGRAVSLCMIDTAFTLNLDESDDLEEDIREVVAQTGMQGLGSELDAIKAVYQSHQEILVGYRPAAPLDLAVNCFYGQDNPEFSDVRAALEQTLAQHIKGQPEIVMVEGDHFSMLSKEHVSSLAAALMSSVMNGL